MSCLGLAACAAELPRESGEAPPRDRRVANSDDVSALEIAQVSRAPQPQLALKACTRECGAGYSRGGEGGVDTHHPSPPAQIAQAESCITARAAARIAR